jgi:hypothetical protein
MPFKRRLGMSPSERGELSETSNYGSCPDLWELDDGRFDVIGTDMTEELKPLLPPDAKCCPYERIVVVTRKTLVMARHDIPES